MAEFVGVLGHNGVRRLVDVRERAISRKAGFSKNGLRAALEAAGIGYVHLRELGTPAPVRRAYKADGDFPAFAKRYEAHLRTQKDPVARLRSLLRDAPSAIMCFEREWTACHRSVLCRALEPEGLRFRHL